MTEIDFIGLISKVQSTLPTVTSLLEKSLSATFAVCVDNNDPENQRRIRVVVSSKPDVMSYWFPRISESGNDEPLPDIGDSVIILAIDGDENQSFYVPVQNLTNPPLGKAIAAKDRWSATDGTVRHTAATDYEILADGEALLSSKVLTTIETSSAVSITMTPTSITIRAPTIFLETGAVITQPYNGLGAVATTFRGAVAFTDTSSVSIKGKQVLTIDSVDSAGHTSVVKGWS